MFRRLLRAFHVDLGGDTVTVRKGETRISGGEGNYPSRGPKNRQDLGRGALNPICP
jgi:hypothetical protein